jgi:hypothetical protein
MQNPKPSVWNFCFLKRGPVQTGRGPLGAEGGWDSEAHRGVKWDPVFQEWDPQSAIGTRN